MDLTQSLCLDSSLSLPEVSTRLGERRREGEVGGRERQEGRRGRREGRKELAVAWT
jgi:hypothetical protein